MNTVTLQDEVLPANVDRSSRILNNEWRRKKVFRRGRKYKKKKKVHVLLEREREREKEKKNEGR